MIELFKLAITRSYHNRPILGSLVLILVMACTQSKPAIACRYNVREVGFVDLHIETYNLFGYISDETDADTVSSFKQAADIGLENSNIEFEIINIDRQKDHPAIKLLDSQQDKTLPSAILVSPDGQSYSVPLAESNRPFDETLRSALQYILSSPMREEILKQAIETFGVILLIKGTDDEKNNKAKKAVSDVIKLISSQMDMLPKPIAHPPVLVEMETKYFSTEKILLWSLGLDDGEVSEPRAAVIYGRGRWIGPMFRGEEITEDNLASVLFVIGQDCECGLDHRWLQGTMLPAKWTNEMQASVAENLGFDPESPMIKMEMSLIVRRGSYSYPGVPFGYREFAVEPDNTKEENRNSPNNVDYTTMSEAGPEDPISEPSISVEPDSSFRKTIFLLVGLCFLVFTAGIVILVRAKNR